MERPAASVPEPDPPAVLPFLAVALALSVLVGIAVGLPDYLPTNDGPQHVFALHASRHLDDVGSGYARFLTLGTTFSQLGFDLVYGIWDGFLSWRGALRASLVTMTLLWAWGVVALVAAAGGRRRLWLGLLGFAAALQWQLYMGFFSFYVATGFGWYVLALAFWVSWTARWRVVIAAGLTCQAFLHPVPALITAGTLGVMALWRVGERATRPPTVRAIARELALCGAMVVPALVTVTAGLGFGVPNRQQFGDLPWTQRAAVAVTAFVSGPAWRSWPLPALSLLALGWALYRRTWREDRRQAACLVAGTSFALVAVFSPFHISGWQFFNMRFSPIAALLLLPLLPLERVPSGIARYAVAVALALFATASNLWALGYNLQLRRASDDLLSGLTLPIKRSGMRLPLIIEPRAGEPQDKPSRTIPFGTANWNAGALYAVEQGGVPAWVFAESARIRRIVWRSPDERERRYPAPERGFEFWLSEPEVANVPGARKAAVNRLLSYAPYYEDVIFYGRPEEVEWLRERDFAIDFQRGGLALARFVACPATLELSPGPQGHTTTFLQFGWAPSSDPIFSTSLPAEPEAKSARPYRVPESPCGEVWFRVVFDEDGDGRVSSGDSTCVGSDAQLRLVAHVTPNARFACAPGQPALVHSNATPR